MRPQSLLSLRRGWPFGLLLASLALTVYAVAIALRTERSDSSIQQRTIADYSAFAGWSYGQHLQESMRSIAREVLGPVNHGDMLHMAPDVPSADELPHYLPFNTRCNCHTPRIGPVPETFLSFRVGDARAEWVINSHPLPKEGWEVDRAVAVPAPASLFKGYRDEDNQAVVQRITRQARDVPDREHGYNYFVLPLSIGPRLLAYTLMPTSSGDTMVYAAQYHPEAVQSILRDVYDNSQLLPPALTSGRRNRDIVDLVVKDSRGQQMFLAGLNEANLGGKDTLPLRFASLVVQAGIRPSEVEALIVGGLPASRLPFLVGILGIAGALSVVAVMQLRREAELAGMRANWISSVSHELRTPLAQIRLYLDTVRLGRAAEPQQRDWALGKVDRETTRLNHLVENVLRFSQVGKDNKLVPRPTDVSSEVRRIVDEFRPLLEPRRVSIEVAIDDVPHVSLRPDSLRHILLNLLDNAVKYGPDGQRITVELSSTASEIRLSVSDQGPGVPASERDDIWRAFARGRSGASTTGSGIGLSIVHDVAEQHHGRAVVDAAPGGGARFTVILPVAG